MSDLSKKFAAAAGKSNRAKCAVSAVFDVVLGSKEQEAFSDAINNPNLSAQVISTVMKEEGVEISAFSVRRHRRKECSC